MTTISDVSTEHLMLVVNEYNKFIVGVMADQQGPVAAAQLGATLLMAGLGFVANRAAEQMKEMFPEESPDDTGDQPGT